MIQQFGLVDTSAKAVSVGDRYGFLTVLAIGQYPNSYKYMAVCRCDCGSDLRAIRFDSLVSGRTVSCGCEQKKRTTTHGLSSGPHYDRHRQMLIRCYDVQSKAYQDYGGRGIKVCERWHDIANFVADMGPSYKDGLELDRIDNDGDYTPENCRWATKSENCNNRRSTKRINIDGQIKSLTEWSQISGVPMSVISSRILTHKWEYKKAVFTPVVDRLENIKKVQAKRWENHQKAEKVYKTERRMKRVLFEGQERTIKEIEAMTGIEAKLLYKRIFERKWSVERATSKGTA